LKGVKNMPMWTTLDTEFLKENWTKMGNISLGIALHKTSRTISIHAMLLKLPHKKPGPAPFTAKREWSKQEVDSPRIMQCIPRSDSNHAVNAYHNYVKAMIVQNKLIEFKKTFQASGRLRLAIDSDERRG